MTQNTVSSQLSRVRDKTVATSGPQNFKYSVNVKWWIIWAFYRCPVLLQSGH